MTDEAAIEDAAAAKREHDDAAVAQQGPMETWLEEAVARAVGRSGGSTIRLPEDRDFMREQDAELAARDEEIRLLREALEGLSAGMNSDFDSTPRVKAEEVRRARTALAAARSGQDQSDG